MSLMLYLDKGKWLTHLRKMEVQFPNYVPVVKGNGYGFGLSFLADAALQIGKDSLAVGTVEEAKTISLTHTFHEILVLTPVLNPLSSKDLETFTFTVGSMQHLLFLLAQAKDLAVNEVKVLLKCQSSMKRYGFTFEQLSQLEALFMQWNNRDNVHFNVQGYSLHFPLARINEGDKLRQIHQWTTQAASLGLGPDTFYLSHLSADLFNRVKAQYPDFSFVMRLGTTLWLDNDAFSFHSTVIDVKQVERGERYGYKQNRARQRETLLIVSGGTSHGIGLEAPLHAKGLKDRLKLTAFWLLALFNLHLSPFVHQSRRLWFAEPPHMQTSVLRLSDDANKPEIGSTIEIKNLRMTIASFDRILETGLQDEQTMVFSKPLFAKE